MPLFHRFAAKSFRKYKEAPRHRRDGPTFHVVYWEHCNGSPDGLCFEEPLALEQSANGRRPQKGPCVCQECEGVVEPWRHRLDNFHASLRMTAKEGPGFRPELSNFICLSPKKALDYNIDKFRQYGKRRRKAVLTEQTVLALPINVEQDQVAASEAGVTVSHFDGDGSDLFGCCAWLRSFVSRVRHAAEGEGGVASLVEINRQGVEVSYFGCKQPFFARSPERPIRHVILLLPGPLGFRPGELPSFEEALLEGLPNIGGCHVGPLRLALPSWSRANAALGDLFMQHDRQELLPMLEDLRAVGHEEYAEFAKLFRLAFVSLGLRGGSLPADKAFMLDHFKTLLDAPAPADAQVKDIPATTPSQCRVRLAAAAEAGFLTPWQQAPWRVRCLVDAQDPAEVLAALTSLEQAASGDGDATQPSTRWERLADLLEGADRPRPCCTPNDVKLAVEQALLRYHGTKRPRVQVNRRVPEVLWKLPCHTSIDIARELSRWPVEDIPSPMDWLHGMAERRFVALGGEPSAKRSKPSPKPPPGPPPPWLSQPRKQAEETEREEAQEEQKARTEHEEERVDAPKEVRVEHQLHQEWAGNHQDNRDDSEEEEESSDSEEDSEEEEPQATPEDSELRKNPLLGARLRVPLSQQAESAAQASDGGTGSDSEEDDDSNDWQRRKGDGQSEAWSSHDSRHTCQRNWQADVEGHEKEAQHTNLSAKVEERDEMLRSAKNHGPSDPADDSDRLARTTCQKAATEYFGRLTKGSLTEAEGKNFSWLPHPCTPHVASEQEAAAGTNFSQSNRPVSRLPLLHPRTPGVTPSEQEATAGVGASQSEIAASRLPLPQARTPGAASEQEAGVDVDVSQSKMPASRLPLPRPRASDVTPPKQESAAGEDASQSEIPPHPRAPGAVSEHETTDGVPVSQSSIPASRLPLPHPHAPDVTLPKQESASGVDASQSEIAASRLPLPHARAPGASSEQEAGAGVDVSQSKMPASRVPLPRPRAPDVSEKGSAAGGDALPTKKKRRPLPQPKKSSESSNSVAFAQQPESGRGFEELDKWEDPGGRAPREAPTEALPEGGWWAEDAPAKAVGMASAPAGCWAEDAPAKAVGMASAPESMREWWEEDSGGREWWEEDGPAAPSTGTVAAMPAATASASTCREWWEETEETQAATDWWAAG